MSLNTCYNHTRAYMVTVNPQWKSLCASASWSDECHSVLLRRLSGRQTKCHFVPPQHSSTNRHRRTPISLCSNSYYPGPHRHTSSPLNPTCAPAQHTHAAVNPNRRRFSCHSVIAQSGLSSISEYQGMFSLSFSCTPTHRNTHTHTTKLSLHLTPDSR